MQIPYKTEKERLEIIQEQEQLGNILMQEMLLIDGNFLVFNEIINPPKTAEEKIAELEDEKTELLQATIDLADIVATQSAQLDEQSEALMDLANTLSEVVSNG